MDLPAQPLVRRLRGLATAPRTADGVLVALAAVVGFGTGLLAAALIDLIAAVQRLAWPGSGSPLGGMLSDRAAVLVIPVLGGLAVGALIRYGVPEVRGGGVAELLTSISLHGGRMRVLLTPAKVVASGLALGTGASGGRETPMVQIGGSVGSSIGRAFALNEEQKRALIAAGGGAGIAAAFNAPIAGMLFALEVIIGGFRARYLQVIVVACVVASVTAREVVGPGLIYSPPPYRLMRLVDVGISGIVTELLLYALLGLCAAIVGVALIRGEDLVSGLIERRRLSPPVALALAGLGVGVIALVVPEVLGTGDNLPAVLGAERNPIARMLDGELTGRGFGAAGILFALLGAKLVTTSLSVGSGSPVGSFSPSVFVGAALGGAIGKVAAVAFPALGVQSGAFALVGMAAVLGAALRSPLTAILIAFELTGDYGLVLPLMLATGIATFVADRIEPSSAYTKSLLRRGIVYGEPEDVDIMQTVRVGEIMTADPDTIPAAMPLADLEEEFRRTRHHGFPVVDGDRLIGVVTVADVERRSPAADARTAADICTRSPSTVTPEDPVFRAVRRMAMLDVGRLPVVSAEDHSRLVGLVRRSDLVKAYQRAVTRSLGVQQRRESSRLRDLAGAHFVELVVDARAVVAGRRVRDVAWPQRTVLTSIRRTGDLVMPNGDTVLAPNDEVVVLTDQTAADEVRRLFTEPAEEPAEKPAE